MLITNPFTSTTTSAQSTKGTTPTDSSPAAANSASPAGESGFEVLRGTKANSLLDVTADNTPTPPHTTVTPNNALFGQIAEAVRSAANAARLLDQIDQLIQTQLATQGAQNTILRGI